MRNTRASIVCGCLAALPLAVCVGAGNIAQQNYPAANVADVAPPRGDIEQVAYTGPAAPVAVLVFVPSGTGMAGRTDVLGAVPPTVWADQGLGVVTPRVTDAAVAEDRDMALALHRMLAYARAMADAPIWLVGADPEIRNALASLPPGRGQISGVVVTSVASPAGTCSKTVVYSSPGRGGIPTVQVRSSGNACEGVNPGMRPPVFEPIPEPSTPPRSPHTILVRNEHAPAGNNVTAPQAGTNERPLVRLIADRIRQSPSG